MMEISQTVLSLNLDVVIQNPKILIFVNKSSRIFGRENFLVNQEKEKLENETKDLREFFVSHGYTVGDDDLIEGISMSDDSTGDLLSDILGDCAEDPNLKNYDSLIVCFLGFTGNNKLMCVDDGKFNLDIMTRPFRGKACPALFKKPKLFLIQMTTGIEEVSRAQDSDDTHRIPVDADLFVGFVTLPRDWTGPSMISQLMKFKDATPDVCEIFTQINKAIHEHKCDESKGKPFSCCITMLTSYVKFGVRQT